MGPGMAAPETSGMRRFRFAVISMAVLLGTGLLGIERIVLELGPVMTGTIFSGLLATTLAIGVIYFVRKARRDDAWLDQLIAEANEP